MAERMGVPIALQRVVTVVPTFLIDGRRLEGVPSADDLNRLLSDAAVVRYWVRGCRRGSARLCVRL